MSRSEQNGKRTKQVALRPSLSPVTGHWPLVITIDGPAGVGKSTAAKRLARHLKITYLDTGATYRALALESLRLGLDPRRDGREIAALARRLSLQLQPMHSGAVRVLLNGVNVTRAIRTEKVSDAAALISRYPEVRRTMVRRQRQWADGHSVVAEGRDTGSVVFPRATRRFFMNADLNVRAHRRQHELYQLSGRQPPLSRIQRQLRFRDHVDRTRQTGRLIVPDGAVRIDTSRLTARQVLQLMLRHINDSPRSTVHGPRSKPNRICGLSTVNCGRNS